ncbi:MAG: tRNA (N6-threonylcarbamoyladenosine(37)-N6)-methyltransferase TrmO [Rubrivivax sp.]|nr:MAG: tRNA (N6-threonylcarbamoyladenosine(37)-N6)-methyltransferase TrmO [Rubrivivax sp.]
MNISLTPIGTIHSVFHDVNSMARQARIDGRNGLIVLNEEYLDGLQGLEDFSHVIALYYFHKQVEVRLNVTPLFDEANLHGIFACRYPKRPNHIGVSIFTLDKIVGNVLHCKDVDVLHGTPLLDIKPYVRQFDQVPNAKSGWYDKVDWDAANLVTNDAQDTAEIA